VEPRGTGKWMRKEETMEPRPAPVPPGAIQAGEVPDPTGLNRWAWTEPSVWTPRMLAALDQGVKGGAWFSLIDKVYSDGNLASAAAKVVANRGAAGVDHVNVEAFADRMDENLKKLQEQLRTGTYRPQAIRRVHIPKPGSKELRPLGIPTVRDRVVQTAIVNVLAPIFERDFSPSSYGFRPNRGCQQALDQVESLLADGYQYVVDADLKSYFDTIPHERLMERIKVKVSDGRLLTLIESFLKAGILEEGLREWTPTAGAPQGAVLSPLLSNVYLDPLDQLMASRGYKMVRYADDFVILCRSREEAERALGEVTAWVESNGLTLHPDKTRIVEASTESFDFLGYRYDRGKRFVRPKSLAKLKETVRSKTRRTDGRSLKAMIADLNVTLRGWFGYFKRCYRTVFSGLDGWIRRRLRSVLRKRMKLKGMSRHGTDEQKRWPNAYFAGQGLYSLKAASERASQPPSG
jgi:RNA-directed DNA polymerase